MSCDFSDYASETLYWDDKSFKVYHPTTITYSWTTLPGGKIINWDTSQNYIVQNPNNFSYSVDQVAQTCRIYFTHPINNRRHYCYGYSTVWLFRHSVTGVIFTFDSQNNPQWQNRYLGYQSPPPPNSTYLPLVPRTDSTFVNNGFVQNVNTAQNLVVYDRQISTNYTAITIQKELINPTYELTIIDGGTTSKYPIINPNSVNVIDLPSNQKEITVNGNKFSLLDENTIELVCTDPIYERCPKDTIECECDGKLCCYAPTDYGWRLVKTISLN